MLRDSTGGSVPSRVMSFDQYVDSYRDAVEESIGFAGGDAARYVGAKARLLVELARRRIGAPDGLHALDVGCGPGETDAFLEGSFGSLSGVDLSSGMTERAARRNPWASYSSYGRAEPLPYEDASFDLSFAICVLHHVPPAERPAFVEEMRRVTRPGGLVAIFEHNPLNPLTRKAVRDCPFDEDAVLLSRGEARRRLADAGLAEVEAPFIIFFPREGDLRSRLERRLGWLPLGAQYYVAGTRGHG
jgi:SAM-dependent methyltransferase